MNNRIVGGVYLARAAQQRKQLRAQRQTREERACEGKKECGKNKCCRHGDDYKVFILSVQQILVLVAALNADKAGVSLH